MARQATSNLKKLKCPFCNNDNVVVVIDFVKKRESTENNIAVCVVRYRKTLLGETKSTGCGKTFKVDFLEKPYFPKYFSV